MVLVPPPQSGGTTEKMIYLVMHACCVCALHVATSCLLPFTNANFTNKNAMQLRYLGCLLHKVLQLSSAVPQ